MSGGVEISSWAPSQYSGLVHLWQSEINALVVDTGRELVRSGLERSKFFPIFTENRLNVIWPLHLNG